MCSTCLFPLCHGKTDCFLRWHNEDLPAAIKEEGHDEECKKMKKSLMTMEETVKEAWRNEQDSNDDISDYNKADDGEEDSDDDDKNHEGDEEGKDSNVVPHGNEDNFMDEESVSHK